MRLHKLALSCATLGPVGYLPAPGTVATLVTLPLVYVLAALPVMVQGVIILTLLGISVVVVQMALLLCAEKDPSYIVLDEVIGCLLTFVGVSLTPMMMVMGFLLFRFFDITKWCGLWRLQLLPGAWGVLMDDCGAGLLSALLLHAVVRLL